MWTPFIDLIESARRGDVIYVYTKGGNQIGGIRTDRPAPCWERGTLTLFTEFGPHGQTHQVRASEIAAVSVQKRQNAS